MLLKSFQRDRFLISLAITFLTVHNYPHPNFSTENFQTGLEQIQQVIMPD